MVVGGLAGARAHRALAVGYLPAIARPAVPLPAGLGWMQSVVRTGVTPAILAALTVALVVACLAGSRGRSPEPHDLGEFASIRGKVARIMSEARESHPAASRGSRPGSGAVHNGSVSAPMTVRGPDRPRLAAPRLAYRGGAARGTPAMLAWAAALALVSRLVLGYLTNPPDQRMVDLDVYRTGGVSVLHGQPIYHILTQAPQLLPFTYPPIAAVFAVPLAMMSWPAAQAVWVAFVYVPLAVTISYAFRPLLTRAGRHAPVVYAALFTVCAYLFPTAGPDAVRPGRHPARRAVRRRLRGGLAALATRRARRPRHSGEAGARRVHRLSVDLGAQARRGDRGCRGPGLDAWRVPAAAEGFALLLDECDLRQ